MVLSPIFWACLCITAVLGHDIPPVKHSLFKEAADPAGFSWGRSWATVGDSFTAGIGSGSVYSSRKEDTACSRYDKAWPVLVNKFLGLSVQRREWKACSGAVGMKVVDQINSLKPGLDLMMSTAGGNDLCLVSEIQYFTRGDTDRGTPRLPF
jgi:hypothetical protein